MTEIKTEADPVLADPLHSGLTSHDWVRRFRKAADDMAAACNEFGEAVERSKPKNGR